jgi:DNA-binding CsgD family transcriptional regulator
MQTVKSLLKPIQPTDFELRVGAGSKEGVSISPFDKFGAIIEQFSKFATGPYFWFIADTKHGLTHSAGGRMEQILPFTVEEFVGKPPDLLFKQMYPADMAAMFSFTNFWITTYLNTDPPMRQHLRPTIYIRLMNAQQVYNWVMVQYQGHIVSEDNKVIYALTFVTNISQIKTGGVALMTILNTQTQTCSYFECPAENSINGIEQEMPKISVREMEILRLVSIGHSSKQIAQELGVSARTIDNHRQNLLRKTGCRSSSELTSYGIKFGLL